MANWVTGFQRHGAWNRSDSHFSNSLRNRNSQKHECIGGFLQARFALLNSQTAPKTQNPAINTIFALPLPGTRTIRETNSQSYLLQAGEQKSPRSGVRHLASKPITVKWYRPTVVWSRVMDVNPSVRDTRPGCAGRRQCFFYGLEFRYMGLEFCVCYCCAPFVCVAGTVGLFLGGVRCTEAALDGSWMGRERMRARANSVISSC